MPYVLVPVSHCPGIFRHRESTHNCVMNKNHLVSDISVEESALLMSDKKANAGLVKADRKTMSAKLTVMCR